MGVIIWEDVGIHIRPGIRGYLISVGSLKFGRFPKGGYNLEKIIRLLGTGGGLIPANFLEFSLFCRLPSGL